MGCGASGKSEDPQASKDGVSYQVAEHSDTKRSTKLAGKDQSNEQDKAAVSGDNGGYGNDMNSSSPRSKNPAPTPDDDQGASLPAREKNVPAPLLREVDIDEERFLVSHYAQSPGLKGATFAIRDPEGCIYYKSYTDAEFTTVKESKVPQLTWNAFWRALAGSFTKEDSLRIANRGEVLELTLRSSKEPKPYQLSFTMIKAGTGAEETHRHFIIPFTALYKKRKEKKGVPENDAGKRDKGVKEEEIEKKEAALNVHEAGIEWAESVQVPYEEKLQQLQKDMVDQQVINTDVQKKIDRLTKNIRTYKDEEGMHPLDGLYSIGGARPFQHSEWSVHHAPKEGQYEPAYLRLIGDGRIAEATPDNVSCLTQRPTDPEVADLVDSLPDDKVWQLIECFEKIDKWDYDAFHVNTISDGNCLFYTSYALFVKYNFIQHFGIPKDVVTNFFSAVQAGYLPNAYHNATHAADVMQITHYVLGPGGMRNLCKLSMEDMMAAIISSAIHDYNHPGLNNNFHTRVSAYLSTLYNDRSVLENHHCACAFELLNHPKYDILQTLNDDQRKEIRDTIVEMLLSTDMGNHAKIFSAFRRRLAEAPDWSKKKEDVRLALVMAIKLADISNCGRPKEIYLKWAERIAEEFYAQGDAEANMCYSISPFMDRRKHDSDFHKGQTSFMSYIVAPLFESVGEVFPRMKFALEMCKTNREYWN
eukprot:TRINITY_DN1667_c0_g2_i1.p1 TRINITY_DN1667_c0_g2~~TRINITY_DN1667_c0_g2_i1.p1  ORF type:complete len:701 (+),score=124.85 TRINITY_DN1667_c0_g2_i1:463-2565(+)